MLLYTQLANASAPKKSQGPFNLAEDADIAERVEVLDIRQLLSANIYEQSLFNDGKRNLILSELVSCYNDIVLQTEMDPSLRIEFDAK